MKIKFGKYTIESSTGGMVFLSGKEGENGEPVKIFESDLEKVLEKLYRENF